MANTPDTPKSDIQGEGNYEAARQFDKDERDFIAKGGVEKKAREAEQALDGEEGEALEKARKDSAKGDPRQMGLKIDRSFDPERK